MSHSSLIDRYESQSGALAQWVDGLATADFDARPVPGTWTIRELVTHMIDADLVYGHRMRKIAAEERALLMGYDESKWAAHPALQAGDPVTGAVIFEAHRRWIAAFLRKLPPEAWTREGVHSERGIVTITSLLENMLDHVPHHEKFLVAKREALGKPMRATAGAAR